MGQQVSKEGQKEGQSVPSDWVQGGHHHFVDISQIKCCPPWDTLWEGFWDDRTSSPSHKEDSGPG